MEPIGYVELRASVFTRDHISAAVIPVANAGVASPLVVTVVIAGGARPQGRVDVREGGLEQRRRRAPGDQGGDAREPGELGRDLPFEKK